MIDFLVEKAPDFYGFRVFLVSKSKKMHFFSIFLPKNLAIQKNSIIFAADLKNKPSQQHHQPTKTPAIMKKEELDAIMEGLIKKAMNGDEMAKQMLLTYTQNYFQIINE